MKVKYQGGITKLIAARIGKKNKLKFSAFINHNLPLVKSSVSMPQEIEIDVVSFSSSNDFYDQILSILSFLRHVGTPKNWTLYSDGSHTKEQIQLLEKDMGFLKVVQPDLSQKEHLVENCKEKLRPHFPFLLDYASKFPLGKKLFYYLNYEVKRPTLFIDSDILFYPKASILGTIINEKVDGWFLPDAEWGCLDSRYKQKNNKQLYQINSGFFILNKEIENLLPGMSFLESLQSQYEYFSEQNVFHILFRENHFLPLDPRTFILNSSDQFDFTYSYSKEQIAVRHYTGPVRHKMWQRGWKWQLSI